jgi:bacillithiol system protein YtxJ
MTNWKHITSEQEVLDIIEKSKEKPQIIFKDSQTCGISAYAKERLSIGNETITDIADFNYLDLLTFRSVSNFIASELNVIHQSPQIIVLIDKKVIFKDSHNSIEAKKIRDKILEYTK